MSIDAVVTDVPPDQSTVPTNYMLAQNYPNPFNPTTQILFAIPQNERVTLSIYNVLGQRIATLVDGMLTQGSHVVTWNGRDNRGMQLPSGVYFYTLKTSSFTASKRMLMLK
jgi:flagellar hook assembly protein FlgD